MPKLPDSLPQKRTGWRALPLKIVSTRYQTVLTSYCSRPTVAGSYRGVLKPWSTGTGTRIPWSRFAKSPGGVKGRAVCPVAANGAPDCKAGADKLCQSKGFKEGKSLDVDTTRNCSARALLSGRKPEESECRTETYVTRAICQ